MCPIYKKLFTNTLEVVENSKVAQPMLTVLVNALWYNYFSFSPMLTQLPN